MTMIDRLYALGTSSWSLLTSSTSYNYSSSSYSSLPSLSTVFTSRRRAMMVAGVPLVVAAAFIMCGGGRRSGNTNSVNSSSTTFNDGEFTVNTIQADEDRGSGGGDDNNDSNSFRSFQTPADKYFAKHQTIPLPSMVHAKFDDLIQQSKQQHHRQLGEETTDANTTERKNIFVIGDVHGCYDEMLELHDKAVQEENDGIPFQFVVLVGDLVNKGPKSSDVIRFVRSNPTWFSVRGNHDDGALAAALGDTERKHKKKYKWVLEDGSLSDADIEWMSNLPYTIEIPSSMLGEQPKNDNDEEDNLDVLIVHAGIVPDVTLEEQEIDAMVTMRDLEVQCDDNGNFQRFQYLEKSKKKNKAIVADTPYDKLRCDVPVTWASIYRPRRNLHSKRRIIFGHNAKRGLQLYDGQYAIGLDTGAVYGRGMTGMILPQRKLVSIKTKEHSPTG